MGKKDIYFPDDMQSGIEKFCEDTGRTVSGWIQTLVKKNLPSGYLKEKRK